MSSVGNYTIPQVVQGLTMEAIEFTVIVDGNPLDLSGATITAKARYAKMTSRVGVFSTTITDAVNGVFEIDEQVIDWQVGNWLYSIQFEWPDGTIKVYIEGSFVVTPNQVLS